jgi:hypothetical protein
MQPYRKTRRTGTTVFRWHSECMQVSHRRQRQEIQGL